MSYVIDPLQRAIADRLRTCATLAGMTIVAGEEESIEQKIEEALAGALGAALFVSEVELGGVSGDLPNVSADDAQFTVVCYHQPTAAAPGMTAGILREVVMRRLHGHETLIPGVGTITLLPDPENGRRRKGVNIREVQFRVSVTLDHGVD